MGAQFVEGIDARRDFNAKPVSRWTLPDSGLPRPRRIRVGGATDLASRSEEETAAVAAACAVETPGWREAESLESRETPRCRPGRPCGMRW